MSEFKNRQLNRVQRNQRVRAKVSGDSQRPRLSVRISNTNVYAQVIDDSKGSTIVASSTVGQKSLESKSLSEKAVWVGADIAKKAKAAKVKTVVFDRGSKNYHGRIKTVADSARKEGMEF